MDDQRNRDRLRMMIGRGVVNLVDDSGPVQRHQVDVGPVGPDGQSLGLRDNTIRAAEFGFASNPPPGTHVIVLSVGGDLSNAIIVATNHQDSRPTGLNPGESCVYDSFGNRILLSATGITMTPADGLKLTINAPAGTEIIGDVAVTGTLSATTDVTGAGISLKTHVHGGVQVGSGNTAGPH